MKRPSALLLADELESDPQTNRFGFVIVSARELRRLHKSNQELIDAANEVLASFDKEGSDGWMRGELHSSDFNRLKRAVASAAISKGDEK